MSDTSTATAPAGRHAHPWSDEVRSIDANPASAEREVKHRQGADEPNLISSAQVPSQEEPRRKGLFRKRR